MSETVSETSTAANKKSIPLRPMVVVGLGGTGRWICGRLKRLYKERLGRVPPHVALLSIDTTRNYTPDANIEALDEPAEFLPLNIANPQDYVRRIAGFSRWFPDHNEELKRRITEVNHHGAGATRPIGRVLVEANWTAIHGRIKNAVESTYGKITRASDTPSVHEEFASVGFTETDQFVRKPTLLVCGNLVSGTCSGSFLEIAHIARLVPLDPDVVGLFTLPPEADVKVEHLVNATAALRELQHFMAIDALARDLRYQCQTAAAQPYVVMKPDYNVQGPYTSVLVSRPQLSDRLELDRLHEQITNFLYGYTATPLGAMLAADQVNLSRKPTTTGDVPVICAFGAYELPDDSTQRRRLLHLMLSDFFCDDITGKANPGESQRHAKWAVKDLIPNAMAHLRLILGLPSAATETDVLTADRFSIACKQLLEHVRNAVMRSSNPQIFGREVQIDENAIADVIIGDPLLRTAKKQADLRQSLKTQIPRALKELDPAFDTVLTMVVRERVQEVLTAITTDLFESGASLEQTCDAMTRLIAEIDHLARRIPDVISARPALNIENILASLTHAAARKIDNLLNDPIFHDDVRTEIRIYLNRKLAAIASRIILGDSGNSVPTMIGGVSFDLAAGLSRNLQVIVDHLRKVQKALEIASSRLEDEGNLRDVRNAASEADLQKLYSEGIEALLARVKDTRRLLLEELKCGGSLIAAASIEPAAVLQPLKSVTAAFVPPLDRRPFEEWWRERGVQGIQDTNFQAMCSLLPLNDAVARDENCELEYAISMSSPAQSEESPHREIKALTSKFSPLLHRNDNSVSIMAIRGHAMLRWISTFEQLTASYVALKSDGYHMEMAHTVAHPERLRPIAFSGTDRMMFYIVGCSLQWIEPVKGGAQYHYENGNDFNPVPISWSYSRTENVHHDRGPIGRLFTRIPAEGSEAPTIALMIEREGAAPMSANSIYQHLQWRINRAFLDTTMAESDQQGLAEALYRLLVLSIFRMKNAGRGIGAAHLTTKQLEDADAYTWITSNVGPLGRRDTINAELRGELKKATLDELIEKYRAIALREEPAPATEAKLDAREKGFTAPQAARLPIARTPAQKREDLFNLLGSMGTTVMSKIRIMSAYDEGLERLVVVAETEGLSAEQVDEIARVVTV